VTDTLGRTTLSEPILRCAARTLPLFLLASRALGAEAGGDETNIFNADIGNLIFTLVIFGVVIWLLGKFAWKPLLSVLNEREKSIRQSLEAARKERTEAERLLAEYKVQLDRARVEATAIVDEGRRDGEVVRQRIQQEARRQAEELLERARREIQLAADTAIKDLYDRTGELAVNLAGNILRQELSPEKHRQLIADSLAQIRTSGKSGLN
jgi:F-type H+-transporting ATPase subunit b